MFLKLLTVLESLMSFGKIINQILKRHREGQKVMKNQKSVGFDKLQKAIRARRNARILNDDPDSMPTDNYERKN